MSDDKKPQSPWGKPGGKKTGGNASGQKGNSPWGRPGAKPTGPRPVNTKPTQGAKGPDLDKFFPGLKARGGSGGGGGRRPRGQRQPFPKGLLFLGAAALILFSSVYTVQGNEQSAVLRFGDYVRTAGPGLNFKLPYPIETKITREVTDQQEINVGATDDESLMVTGDENIVDLEFTVLYVIKDLGDFLFEVEKPDELVQATAESVVREVIGMNELEAIITTQRAPLIAAVTQQLQSLLDEYQAGVQIIDVQFQKTDPPEGAVLDAFDRVVASAQEAEADVNNARAEFNKVTLEAEGRAAAILEEAQAYRDTVIAVSAGEAERFLKVYEEYRKAPEVTRRRIYLETMEEVYARGDKVILDGDAGSGAVPYLPLNELNRGGGQ